MYCKYCGHALSGEEKFCPACGGAVNYTEHVQAEQAQTEAAQAETTQTEQPNAAEQANTAQTPALPVFPPQNVAGRCPRCGQMLTVQDEKCPFCAYPIVRSQPNAAPFYAPPPAEKKKGLPFGIVSIVLAFFSPLLSILLLLPDFMPLIVALLPFALAAAFGGIATYQGSKTKNTAAIITGVIGIVLAVLCLILFIILFIFFVYLYLAGGLEYY